MEMACYVCLPNSYMLDIKVNPKGFGQQCMDQVCKKLGIIEQDYFGLQYVGSRSEELWLNLRNRIDRQLAPPFRLNLRVKFFVEPHRLLQPSAREIFYFQVKEELESGKLVVDDEKQLLTMLSYMAQAEFGNFDHEAFQFNQYSTLLKDCVELTPHMVECVAEMHMQLTEVSKESAQYNLLKEAATLRNFGVEYHEAVLHNDSVKIGVGPTGIVYYTSNMEPIERLEYIMISKAEHLGKSCTLRVLNDNGMIRELEFKLNTQPAANALYRSVTEMHSFFCCDTVHDDVSAQFSRDFKGMLASIFNVNTTLGLDYVFDIKRTSQEAYDHARRALFKAAGPECSPRKRHLLDNRGNPDCDSRRAKADLQLKQRVLEETLEKIEESLLCIVCREMENSAVLCPCGHVTCMDCANKLSSCPLCRKDITGVQKVFLPTVQIFQESVCSSSISLIPKKGATKACSRSRRKGFKVEEMEVAES